MLLGQIVAISFAANLSFLAFLVFEDVDTSAKVDKKERTMPSSTKSHGWLRNAWLAVLAVTVGCALAIPSNLDHPKFMYLLLAPHVLAFAPLLLNKVIGGQKRTVMDEQPPPKVRAGIKAVVVGVATWNLFGAGADWGDVLSALYEHPAVSSVGWDVICCWISFGAWHVVCWAEDWEKKHGVPVI